MIRARVVLAAGGFALLAGCVTDPGYARIDPAEGKHFGYTDTPNNEGGYTISVILPQGVTDPRQAFAHWDRRAAELCPGGYRKQLHTARVNMLEMHGYTPTPLNYTVSGDAYCNETSAQASIQGG